MNGEFPKTVEYGLCYCGCGEKTKLATQSSVRDGWIKGQPIKFIRGHNNGSGKNNPNWKNGKTIHKCKSTCYFLIYLPEHPRSNHKGYIMEHILITEKINNGPLPRGAVVHHIDGNGLNNNENNLMIFQSSTEHNIYHRKERAFKICGHDDWRKCKYCKRYDSVENLHMELSGNGGYHKKCKKEYDTKRYIMQGK